MDQRFPSSMACDLKISGNALDCNDNDNLIVRAYNLLAAHHDIPRIHAHLVKNIPSQAGLGGGSSDAAYMLRLLNDTYRLGIDNRQLETYAAQLGADCAFFVYSRPAAATGIGDKLAEIDIDNQLKDKFIVIVKPEVSVSTRTAYSMITPKQPAKSCMETVRQPIDTWRESLTNDFELPVFTCHPQVSDIKTKLYDTGAVYAQMSGSGSAFFGIFGEQPANIERIFPDYYTTILKL